MRDRLIELIKEGEDRTPCAFDPECDCEDKKCGDCVREAIADHLLANGIIVPQVNVGDKLYYISGVGKIVENEVWYVGAFAKGTCYTEEGTPILTSVFLDCDANRHYYFTKEEAEKALAERSGE